MVFTDGTVFSVDIEPQRDWATAGSSKRSLVNRSESQESRLSSLAD
jgi:hypothetical protein